MANDIRRHWQLALAALLIWSAAGLLGSIGQAADGDPAQAEDADAQAIADRLDAMIERAARRVGQRAGDAAAPDADESMLREQLEEAQTQIKLLKNVVIQALRAQSAAEEALRRERIARQTGPAAKGEAGAEPMGSSDLMLADQLEALTESVRRLRADVDALQAGASREESAAQDVAPPGAAGDSEGAMAAPPLEADAMLGSGMGGAYQPLIEDEPPESGPGDVAAGAGGEPLEVAQVLFNTGSAELTASGERRALEAVERIKSMGAAKVRVVGWTDRVGDAAYNLVLSKERALSIAAVLESVGLGRDMVEVVGNGEDDIPVPTPDGVAEPLNRRAGIFVVPASAG